MRRAYRPDDRAEAVLGVDAVNEMRSVLADVLRSCRALLRRAAALAPLP